MWLFSRFKLLCRTQYGDGKDECRVQNAELDNAKTPLHMGEVAGAKRVTERDFEEIEVAPKVTERGRDKFRV